MVQKHAARRLHYDFRLELDGVLKSWAVTRGPSLSPADKRLAVRTEDHPLDYAEFEGRIPQGEYGAGSVIVWDRGRWSTEGDPHQQLAKGHLIVDLEGSKLKGRWHLVHMKGRDQRGKENWLLIKADDEHAVATGGMSCWRRAALGQDRPHHRGCRRQRRARSGASRRECSRHDATPRDREAVARGQDSAPSAPATATPAQAPHQGQQEGRAAGLHRAAACDAC